MNDKNVKSGLSFIDLLQVALIVLRLCGVIDWKWRWVLAPLFAELAFCGLLLVGVLITLCFEKKK